MGTLIIVHHCLAQVEPDVISEGWSQPDLSAMPIELLIQVLRGDDQAAIQRRYAGAADERTQIACDWESSRLVFPA